MELLNNKNISKKLNDRTLFDLSLNNQKLQVIVLIQSEPIEKLKTIFNKLIIGEEIIEGYYNLYNLFTQVHLINPNVVINLIVNTHETKISMVHDIIYDKNSKLNEINIGMYMQLWKYYRDFTQKMYVLINIYQKFLTERNILMNKLSYDILSILQLYMFYNDFDINIFTSIQLDLDKVNIKNIEQLIDYIGSIRSFMLLKDFIPIEVNKLNVVIKALMLKTNITNTICQYMHHLLVNLANKQTIGSQEYKTIDTDNIENIIIGKIYKISTLLSTYAEKKRLLFCYTKFMQTRIIDLTYDNLELEIELVKRMSYSFGRINTQKLLDAITDIIDTKNIIKYLHPLDGKMKSVEYSTLTDVSTKILNPIILTKSAWNIFNTSTMEINYPIELKHYLTTISKFYSTTTKNKYNINWQPTIGSAQFRATLGPKKIDITCNILQAIALIYLNDNPQTSIDQFCKDTSINYDMSKKIFKSLDYTNLIISLKSEKHLYIINTLNYLGSTQIDIRQDFIKMFEMESG